MRKTVEQIIYDIVEITKPYYTDDTNFDEEFIIEQINDVRNELLKQAYVSGRMLDDQWYSKTCCIELKCDNIVCDSLDSGDVDWYSELPNVVGGIGNRDIIYLGDTNMNTSGYDRVNIKSFQTYNKRKWTGYKCIYVVIGGKAYFKNLPTTGLKYLCLIGITSGPTSLCDSTRTDKYPIPDVLLYKLKIMVVKQILVTLQVPEDIINDAIDNTMNAQIPKNVQQGLQEAQK